jgi:hypothetical protein
MKDKVVLFSSKLPASLFTCDFYSPNIFVFGGEDGFCEVFCFRIFQLF